MREPIGTTRKGQLLLGALGLVVGLGSAYGLEVEPTTFEPTFEIALHVLGRLIGEPLDYDPSQRTYFAVLMPILGAVWALLFAYAFIREPARNKAIDAHMRRRLDVDRSRRNAAIRQHDESA
jgi:hypothetical protein